MILRRFVLILFILGVGAIVYYVVIPYVQNFQSNTIEKQISIEINSNEKTLIPVLLGSTQLFIDIAVTNSEKERGLSGRFFINDDYGLLFVYESEGYPAIWMKDMIFPIDIAWLDTNFRIVHIEKNVSPSSYPTAFRSDLPARYVLEVSSGFFDEHSIVLGETMRIVEK